MSAELLRRAAEKMRENAEAASSGPWHIGPDPHGRVAVRTPQRDYVAEAAWNADHEHIASWHPDVALAVADWLDATANRIDNSRNHGWRGTKHAVTVARAYLGEAS